MEIIVTILSTILLFAVIRNMEKITNADSVRFEAATDKAAESLLHKIDDFKMLIRSDRQLPSEDIAILAEFYNFFEEECSYIELELRQKRSGPQQIVDVLEDKPKKN